MHKSHMKKLLKMDRFHLVIIMCNIVYTIKLAKWTLRQVFFCQVLVHPTMPRPLNWIINSLKVFFKILKLFSTKILAQESLLLSKACRIKCLTLICMCGTINHKSKGYPLSLIKYGLMPSCKIYSLNNF